MKKKYIFIGMAGVGKSTIGKHVANAFSLPCIDTDTIFVRKHQMTIQTYVKTFGADRFYHEEGSLVKDALKNHTFLSPGGSFIYSTDIIEALPNDTIMIYLKDTPSNIKKRIPNINERGIIRLDCQSFESLLAERDILYAKYSDVIFSLTHASFDETTQNIIKFIQYIEK